jgi:hypothetical protein
MKTKIVLVMLVALLVLTPLSQLTAADSPSQSKNPIDREWTLVVTTNTGTKVAIDRRSFKVVKPTEEFTFDTLTVFGNETGIQPPGLPKVAAHVTTMRAVCSKREAQIISDTLHDTTGKIVAVNEATKIDKMSTFDDQSVAGQVINRVCAGRSVFDKSPSAKQNGKLT